MLKEHAERRARHWQRAFQQIAQDAGKDSALYKALGSAAWGRGDHEGDGKDAALMRLGWYEGLRHGLLHHFRAEGHDGIYALERIHDVMDRYTEAEVA